MEDWTTHTLRKSLISDYIWVKTMREQGKLCTPSTGYVTKQCTASWQQPILIKGMSWNVYSFNAKIQQAKKEKKDVESFNTITSASFQWWKELTSKLFINTVRRDQLIEGINIYNVNFHTFNVNNTPFKTKKTKPNFSIIFLRFIVKYEMLIKLLGSHV